jgi:hypothetical protein
MKKKVEKKKEDKKVIKEVKTCSYSGLPSVESYMTETK